ncbi:family 20 glycosylhydrolase [Niabella yanshanensis]|uniref:beta-N-acetylhexosaminidase n=1 Tax=Niabella yanshanensis TaxID=577386 RepID=A0ABZ0W2S0_9BACT|nr:family 20 glycosylhydrolase [Niabella yanshanensis]WQD37411.1 family 20 glycosylhydrolase [Niabella yanshanensis]
MTKNFSLTILLLTISFLTVRSQQPIKIIPEPVSVTGGSGSFKLPKEIRISAPASTELAQTLKFLEQKLTTATGNTVVTTTDANAANISLELVSGDQLGKEGYTLSVTPAKVFIKANKPAGLFYGIQSLLQLLPPAIESKQPVENVKWEIPVVEIKDQPKLSWRGLMLDVSRHFFTVDEVKQYIDAMVRYKYNILHFHLTDDEGWRLEIKSLPKLTSVGAWRINRTGTFNSFGAPEPNEPKAYGGFYTHEDIKELVRYASERFVNIIPEIDVPGHSLAAIAAYPELSCTPGADKYQPRYGQPIMDWSRGAPPIALLDNTLCPANEKVYGFMDKVLTEVAQLFPFEYIHLGGDEAPHNFWEKNAQVQALMKREGLKTIPQVQAYFEKRVEQIVKAKGKKMMGWDEVLEGGVSPSTAIMSWRGEKAGIEASQKGHYVVMSPTTYAYIDYMQGDMAVESPVYAKLLLNQSYKFNPLPKGANAKYILGGQANLWTEQIYNIRYAEYMTWPRGFAISESLWSPEEKKNWDGFVAKTEDHFKRLQYAETNYSPAIYDPAVTVKKLAGGQYAVELTPEISGLTMHYSFDNSPPDNFYPAYKEPLIIPKGASQLRIITYRNKEKAGRMMNLKVDELQKRVK